MDAQLKREAEQFYDTETSFRAPLRLRLLETTVQALLLLGLCLLVGLAFPSLRGAMAGFGAMFLAMALWCYVLHQRHVKRVEEFQALQAELAELEEGERAERLAEEGA